MEYCASWSGGKDSCLAVYLAMQRGIRVSRLVHFDRPNNLHGVDSAMIRLQAVLARIPLIQKNIQSNDFEREFKETVNELKRQGVGGMIFGDIFLEPHKEWVDRTCSELGIIAEEPLWGRKSEDIIKEFLGLEFETIIASGDRKLIDKKFIGKKMDDAFIDYLRSRRLDVCGENGEFHTFVTGGPLFRGHIEITRSDVTERDGFWFLDVKDYCMVCN